MGQNHIDGDDDNDGEDCYWPKYTFFFFFIIWPRWVLVAAFGIFIPSCEIFC